MPNFQHASPVQVVSLGDSDIAAAQCLAEKLGLNYSPLVEVTGTGLALALGAGRLELRQLGEKAPGAVFVDFVDGTMGHRRRFGGGRGQLVAKAVGMKKGVIPDVIDATAGLGRDAFILAMLGCEVRMIERSPIVAALLQDGVDRALIDDEVESVAQRMSLTVGNATQVLAELAEQRRPDVVYVDPMHPGRDKRSAAVKKEMKLFRQLVGADQDAQALLSAALAVATKRVVVKRPRKAEAIDGPKPSLVYEGKSTRFDVYLIPKAA